MVSGFHFASIKYNPRYFTWLVGSILHTIKYNPRYFTWLVGSILHPLSIILGILHG